jgi:cell division protein FtsL
MSTHLASISQRQVTGRWMDRGFLVVLLIASVISASSVAMAVSAARTAVTSSQDGHPAHVQVAQR